MKLNARQRLPIGAIIEKPAAPVLEEFSVVPGQGTVQFERALTNNVTLRKKFSLSALPNEKDNYVAQMEVDFQNQGAAPLLESRLFRCPWRRGADPSQRSAELHSRHLVHRRQSQVTPMSVRSARKVIRF